MLALARRIPEGHNYIVGGRWVNPVGPYVELRGVELAGRTLGIVGLGAIGRRLAEIAGAIGMTCIGHDPFVESPPPGVRLAALDEVMARSDFVSVHAPQTGETEGLIDSRRIALMKPTAYIVNLSGAGIVDRGRAERPHSRRGDCRSRAGRLRDSAHRSRPSAADAGQRGPDAPRGWSDGRDDRAPLQDDGGRHSWVPRWREAGQPGQPCCLGGELSSRFIVVVDAGSTRIRCFVFDERAAWSFDAPRRGAISTPARLLHMPGSWMRAVSGSRRRDLSLSALATAVWRPVGLRRSRLRANVRVSSSSTERCGSSMRAPT